MAKKAPEVASDTYEKFCKTIKVYDLTTEALSYKRTGYPSDDSTLKMKIFGKASDCKFTYDGSGFLVIKIPLGFKVNKANKDGKTKREIIFDMKVVYNLICQTEIKMDNETLERFAEEHLPLLFFPYFRELIHCSLVKAGLPPLMVPFMEIKGKGN
ncbi:protein-export chaperone SecB [uncultured Sphaerochaeta sp.]|uniref:protein-export chaperone SecB n=1 Tax=uncultured Sphaerochaeta sp. TaxID=886478 RepID=UPI0026039884|nr:protein-export chaperone SecB [uncultured Sphaerochaeta sp.]